MGDFANIAGPIGSKVLEKVAFDSTDELFEVKQHLTEGIAWVYSWQIHYGGACCEDPGKPHLGELQGHLQDPSYSNRIPGFIIKRSRSSCDISKCNDSISSKMAALIPSLVQDMESRISRTPPSRLKGWPTSLSPALL
ncbi:hypothetical protein J6590_071099 [Homalodisca vitripennis]|nr:hypothetical protein J6590_071099 [Homalodisca vitripennis]